MMIVAVAIVLLGILVTTHELGHFLVAKACGIRVLRFSLGFGPKVASFTRGGTEYALSWVPLGGYVRMAGEAPADDEEEEHPPGTRFMEKPVGARAAVVVAGPLMNYLLALVIFITFLWVMGVETVTTRVVGVVSEDSPAALAGILPGDELVSLAGRELSDWEGLARTLTVLPAGKAEVTFLRGDSLHQTVVELPVPEEGRERLGVGPHYPPVAGTVRKGGAAHGAGMRAGDRIISIDERPVDGWYGLVEVIYGAAGRELDFRWVRGDETLGAVVVPEAETIPVSPTEKETVGLIGILRRVERRQPSFREAVIGGWDQTNWWCGQLLGLIPRLVREVAKGRVPRDMVGGPLFIGELAHEYYSWGWIPLLNLVAILSVNLALINLLPIPILDGGQLLLLLPEGVLRRPLTLKQRLVLQQIGLVLVILLVLVVTALDVERIIQR